MTHTPGPWIVNPSAFNNTIHAMGDSEPLATCHVSTDMHGKGRDGITMLQANARLIAAAPELLEMLVQGEDIISGLEAECDNAGINMLEVREWWCKAFDLINKAKGV